MLSYLMTLRKAAARIANVNEIDFGNVFSFINTGSCAEIIERFGGASGDQGFQPGFLWAPLRDDLRYRLRGLREQPTQSPDRRA